MPIITYGGGGLSVQLSQFAITNDEILALPTTSIDLVPALGPGMAIYFAGATYTSIFGGDGYGNINANPAIMSLRLGDGGPLVGQNYDLYNGTLLYGPNSIVVAMSPFGLFTNGDIQANEIGHLDTFENQPITLAVDNSTGGNFTGGDPDNVMKVSVFWIPVNL